MHQSSIDLMARCIDTHLPTEPFYRILDLGSAAGSADEITYRALLKRHRYAYIGMDIDEGHNVDIVLQKPYRIPLRSNSVDVVLSGQTFEHVTFFWATMLEVARVLRPGGQAFITAPSHGHVHFNQDLWRYYPDSWRALASHARLSLVDAGTDFPPTLPNGRFDLEAIKGHHYWGDSFGVFRKPRGQRAWQAAVAREVMVWWGNRVNGLGSVPAAGNGPPRTSRVPELAQVKRARSVRRNAVNQILISLRTYLDPARHYRVLDLGWHEAAGHAKAHKALLRDYDVDYRRVDLSKGGRRGAYRLPTRSGTVDIIICSQALAHVPYFWATTLEMARVLRPGGLAFIVTPSRGHPSGQDCWRLYPDAFRSIAAHTGMTLREAWMDRPAKAGNRWDYGSVPAGRYWGDAVGVLEKPDTYSRWRTAPIRTASVWWAGRAGAIAD